MIEFLYIAQGIIERGLIFSLVAASVHFASKLIKFDNLSLEGAFGIGGASTILLLNCNIDSWLVVFCSVCIGGLSGAITGLLNTKLKLNHLISGIVVSTGLFSISLKLAGSNMMIGSHKTIFTLMPLIFAPLQSLILLLCICFAIFYLIHRLLKTEVGFLLHTVGDTPQMLINIGKSVDHYIIFGLVISNMLAAFSGALFVQYIGYFSIWSTVGILIIGLASMIIAQAFSTHFGIALLIGSIAYQAIIAITFELQVDQVWNKLITALLIVLLIIIKQWIEKIRIKSCSP